MVMAIFPWQASRITARACDTMATRRSRVWGWIPPRRKWAKARGALQQLRLAPATAIAWAAASLQRAKTIPIFDRVTPPFAGAAHPVPDSNPKLTLGRSGGLRRSTWELCLATKVDDFGG